MASSNKEGGPGDKPSDSQKEPEKRQLKAGSDQLLKLMTDRLNASTSRPKQKLSLREMCAKEWKAVTSYVPL